jgi:hypothetical protein
MEDVCVMAQQNERLYPTCRPSPMNVAVLDHSLVESTALAGYMVQQCQHDVMHKLQIFPRTKLQVPLALPGLPFMRISLSDPSI